MPKTQIVYARLELRSFQNTPRLTESKYDINERLYEVMNDEFYQNRLLIALKEQHPERIEPWTAYKERTSKVPPRLIRFIAKFAVTGQNVTLNDVRFY